MEATGRATAVVAAKPAGLVLLTQFTNRPGESHGSFVGDLSVLNNVRDVPAPPTIYARLEDLATAGVAGWDGLAQVQTAHLTWDADVFSPGTSVSVVARIPGADSSRAVLLSSHIDSPNSPGALDNGSAMAALLEVARVIGATGTRPPVDLYLAWFGSEELGLYGSSYFVATHQDLVDHTMAMLSVDSLSSPLEGPTYDYWLVTWSYGRLGDARMPWPDYLAQTMQPRGTTLRPAEEFSILSDNTGFIGFGVPNTDLAYASTTEAPHYWGHWHDPYETIDLVRPVGDQLLQMTRTALVAALQAGQDKLNLQVAPAPSRRAVFLAGHTESIHMSPTALVDLGTALTWAEYDVDMIPYGQPVTPADLEGADLVFALPPYDYAGPDVTGRREAWAAEETAAIESYVSAGGMLVLTDSAHRLALYNAVTDINEDWSGANPLATRFGVTYQEGLLYGSAAQTEGQSALVKGVSTLLMAQDNGVPFGIAQGEVLARVGDRPAAALVDHGRGQILVLADLGMLGARRGETGSLSLWRNLADYAKAR